MDSSRPGLLDTPLGQFGLGAVALVVGAALLFALVGAVSGDEGGDDVAAAPTTDAGPDDTGTATDAPTATTTPDDTTDAPDGSTDAPDDPTGDATDPAATEAPTGAGDPAIDPSTITIQVLNGSDAAADHDGVVSCLEEAGYGDLITGNRARTTYTTTTVFFTSGSEAEAQQVATALGIGAVEEQPGNLSESVPVHIVSGQDGADLC